MAMEIYGNLPDYAIRKQNYSSYAAQDMTGSSAANGTKKKETEKTQETTGNSKSKSTTDYANELAKLVPSAEFRIGNSYSTEKTGITLTVSPKLLEKMQHDPETEKEMKELIRGVETKNKLAEKWNKMTGTTTVFCHDWIDENGKFYSFSQTVREDKLNKKLRREAQENTKKLIEKTKEKAAEKKEKLEETLETMEEKKEDTDKTAVKEPIQAGANLDLQI